MPFGRIGQRLIFKTGSHLLRREQWRQAATLLRRAVRMDRAHWQSHQNLATALLKLERWEEAGGVVQRAISLNPTAAESHANFGIALLKMDRWEEAVAAYERAIKLNVADDTTYERLGSALFRLGRWNDAATAYKRAVDLRPGDRSLHDWLGESLSRLGRWEDAAKAFRGAIDLYRSSRSVNVVLEPGQPDAYAGFANALAMGEASEQTVSHARLAVAKDPADAAEYLSLGVAALKLGRWEEAQSALDTGASVAAIDTTFHFLRVEPLLRQGRAQEAAASQARTIGRGGPRPILPTESVATSIERRRAAFWTAENLHPEVFATERWLADLSGTPRSTTSSPPAKLMFVLDNDYGELTTVMYFLLGQSLLEQTTLLLPRRLYDHNTDIIAGRTCPFVTPEDVLAEVDRERPDIVFLCSGYLFGAHGIFTHEVLERLIQALRERGCRVVTSDPFLGMLSKQDPSTLLTFDLPTVHPWSREKLLRVKHADEERMWAFFTKNEQLLRDMFHLYPTYTDVSATGEAETDRRNICFFNEKLIRPEPASNATQPSTTSRAGKPHWLFILSSVDYDMRLLYEGELQFADIVAAKLLETLAAGRHPILIAPNALVQILQKRMPTMQGVDIMSYCSFPRFMALLLSAEHAFYWNVVSHSLLIRLFNGLPIVLFSRGHLTHGRPALFERVVQWYYQGWEPTIRDHREPLTVEKASAWAQSFLRESRRLRERFRRAPTPDEMVSRLVQGAAAPSV